MGGVERASVARPRTPRSSDELVGLQERLGHVGRILLVGQHGARIAGSVRSLFTELMMSMNCWPPSTGTYA
jgi:hypothetical protein